MNEKRVLYYEFETPISAFLDGKDIGLDSTNITCSLIGINVYPKEAITFSIIVNGSLYDYISPLNVVHSFKNSESFVKTLKDLVYNNNESENFVVYKSKYLENKKIVAFFKNAQAWLEVEKYYFSIDWLYNNDKRHFVLLSNGQFAFVPNHKIKLDGKLEFDKNLKKIKEIYKV